MNFMNRRNTKLFVNWHVANSCLILTLLSSTCFGQGLSTLPKPGQPGYQPLQNLIMESDSIKAQIRYLFGLSVEGIHLKDGSFNMINDDIGDDPDLLPKDKAALSDQIKDLNGDDIGDTFLSGSPLSDKDYFGLDPSDEFYLDPKEFAEALRNPTGIHAFFQEQYRQRLLDDRFDEDLDTSLPGSPSSDKDDRILHGFMENLFDGLDTTLPGSPLSDKDIFGQDPSNEFYLDPKVLAEALRNPTGIAAFFQEQYRQRLLDDRFDEDLDTSLPGSPSSDKDDRILHGFMENLFDGLDTTLPGSPLSYKDDGPIVVFRDDRQTVDSEFTVTQYDNLFSLNVVPPGEGNATKFTLIATPDDQFAVGRGAWGQAGRDQWALEKIGLTPQVHSQILSKANVKADPVIVAVIDSGIDFRHPELWGQLWRNKGEIPFNGRDDDRNGYVDDVYGFNTQSGSSNIIDDNGHGTHVAGIIAARWDSRGIAGIAPQCQIMTVKAFDEEGKSDAARVALGIRYAVLNKAKIIHISAESSGKTDLDQAMIDWARSKGVLVIAASGSRGRDTTNVAPASLKGVLTVGACDRNDKRSKFSGWGQHVDLVAPGIDILSLRAQGTDFMYTMAGKALGIKENERVVNQRWYRAEGTSFAAPLVTGVAAALWAAHPDLTAEQIEKKLIMSCDDIETPGWDILTGAGRLNAAKALNADPDHYLGTRILKISARNQNGKRTFIVPGEAIGSQFQRRWLQLAYGASPVDSDWKTISVSETPVNNGILGEIPGTLLNRRGTWTIRSTVKDTRGEVRQAQVTIKIK